MLLVGAKLQQLWGREPWWRLSVSMLFQDSKLSLRRKAIPRQKHTCWSKSLCFGRDLSCQALRVKRLSFPWLFFPVSSRLLSSQASVASVNCEHE